MTLFSSSPFVIDFIVYEAFTKYHLAIWLNVQKSSQYLICSLLNELHFIFVVSLFDAQIQNTLLMHSLVLLALSFFLFSPLWIFRRLIFAVFSVGTIRANIHKVKDCWQYINVILLLFIGVIFVSGISTVHSAVSSLVLFFLGYKFVKDGTFRPVIWLLWTKS